MKQITTVFVVLCLMVTGISLAIYDSPSKHQQAMAAPVPQWSASSIVPLDLKLDLDKRLSSEAPIKDSVHIRDSVRITEKVRWKVRYKTVTDRTSARDAGIHPPAVTPDSLMRCTAKLSTLGREEQPKETVDASKVSSIQLSVDGEVVYSSNDNHSGVEGQ